MSEFPPIIPHSRPDISKEDISAVTDLLQSSMIAEGQKSAELEKLVASRNSCVDAVSTASGKNALALALFAVGISGRGVITTTQTCREVAEAIELAGGLPVLVDVTEDYRMCRKAIAEKIAQSAVPIGAIIAVHPFGLAEDIHSLSNFGLPVIEDCCHAFGAQKNNQHLGSQGVCSVFSFHATKLLTSAEGGAVASTDWDFIKRVRSIKEGDRPLGSGQIRFPSSLSDLHASLLISQLGRYDYFIDRRKKISMRYREALSDWFHFIERDTDVIFREPMRHKNADEILKKLSARGVIARRPVEPLLHHQIESGQEFPMAEKLFQETISLPLYPALSDEEVERVIEASLNAVNY